MIITRINNRRSTIHECLRRRAYGKKNGFIDNVSAERTRPSSLVAPCVHGKPPRRERDIRRLKCAVIVVVAAGFARLCFPVCPF